MFLKPPSEKALAFRVCYRSKQGTLDGSEMNRLHESVIEKIRQKTGARLREGLENGPDS